MDVGDNVLSAAHTQGSSSGRTEQAAENPVHFALCEHWGKGPFLSGDISVILVTYQTPKQTEGTVHSLPPALPWGLCNGTTTFKSAHESFQAKNLVLHLTLSILSTAREPALKVCMNAR